MDCAAHVVEYVTPQWFLGVPGAWEIDLITQRKLWPFIFTLTLNINKGCKPIFSSLLYVSFIQQIRVPLVCHTAHSLIPFFTFIIVSGEVADEEF